MGLEQTALYTTVYPEAVPYLRDWYNSYRAQAKGGVDLWIGVDGLSKPQVIECFGDEPRANWILAGPGESGRTVRLRAMQEIIEQYDSVIFVDSDDIMSPSRIQDAQLALREHDLVGCALRVVDQQGNETGAVFAPEADWQASELLVRHNIFGLSNTAYRAEVLRLCLPFPKDCVLIDWFLATRAWLADADLWFDRKPGMFYRQHGLNTARILPPFDGRDIMLATRRVLTHYDCVLGILGGDERPQVNALRAAQAETERFNKAMIESPKLLASYTRCLNVLRPRYIWWWAVANPQLCYLWKN